MLIFLIIVFCTCPISLFMDFLMCKKHTPHTMFVAFVFGPFIAIRFILDVIMFVLGTFITTMFDPLIDSLYSDDDERKMKNWKDLPEDFKGFDD